MSKYRRLPVVGRQNEELRQKSSRDDSDLFRLSCCFSLQDERSTNLPSARSDLWGVLSWESGAVCISKREKAFECGRKLAEKERLEAGGGGEE